MSRTSVLKPLSIGDLIKSGDEYVALCPFHEERHPSLHINLEKGVYHCFGCGAKGRARDIVKGMDWGLSPRYRGEKRGFQLPVMTRGESSAPSSLLEREDIGEMVKQVGAVEQGNRYKECGVIYDKYRCDKCGAPIARAHFCDLFWCEACRRRHRKKFFEKHKEKLLKGSGLYHTFRYGEIVVDPGKLREGIRWLEGEFKGCRQEYGAVSGLVAPCFRKEDNRWRLWLEVLVRASDEDYGKFALIAMAVSRIAFRGHKRGDELTEAWSAFCSQGECRLEFENLDELAEIVNDLKHIKWYYGFGEFFKVSGWKGKQKPKSFTCPVCGGYLQFLGMTRDIHVFWDEDEGIALWSEMEVVKGCSRRSPLSW